MQFLIDTHIFLWFVTDDPQLSFVHKEAMQDPTNLVFFSSVSACEIAIKYSIRKLSLPQHPSFYIPQLRKQHQFLEMPLEEASSLMLSVLPLFHKDPFDRLLICQALSHGLTLITDDILILKYDVPTL